jgi:predicted transcriptional regulator
MTRSEAIDAIAASLPRLSDERVQALADIAQSWSHESARPPEDDVTRSAIARGLEEAERGVFATEQEVAEAYKRFRG